MKKIITLIIGSRSNLSEKISGELNFVDLLSTNELTKSLSQLDIYKNKKINIIFNNFQPSSKLNSLQDPSNYIDISIHITIKILMYLIAIKADIKKVIYTSSSSVYGLNSNFNTRENIEPHATNIHGLLKYLNEKFLREICTKNNINYTVTRVFNMYGGNDNFSVVSKLWECYINNKVLTLSNKGESIRDFVHVDNVADIYVRLITDNSINYPILNIGSGNGYSLADIIQKLSKHGFLLKIKYNLNNEIHSSVANIEKLNSIVDVSKFTDINDYLVDKFGKT